MVVKNLCSYDGFHIQALPVTGRVNVEFGRSGRVQQELGRGSRAVGAQSGYDKHRPSRRLIEDAGDNRIIFDVTVGRLRQVDIPTTQVWILPVFNGKGKGCSAPNKVIPQRLSQPHGPYVVQPADKHARATLQIRIVGLR